MGYRQLDVRLIFRAFCTPIQYGTRGYKKVITSTQPDKLSRCPALTTVKSISGKWKTRILWLLRSDVMQYSDLKKQLPYVSPKVLTEQLRQLEADGLIYHQITTKGNQTFSHYGYTRYGATLVPVLDAMGNWGITHENRQRVTGTST